MGAEQRVSSYPGGVYRDLILLLEKRGVDFCLLKGTSNLAAIMEGKGDLDLLVHPSHVPEMANSLLEVGFKPARSLVRVPTPAQWHYFRPRRGGGWDHVHLHSAVLCTEQLRTSHLLTSMTEVYLAHSEYRNGIRVPGAGAEYAHLLLKVFNRFASLPDLALLITGRWSPWQEIAAVRARATVHEAAGVLHEAGLALSPDLLSRCDSALAWGRLTPGAIRLGRSVRRRLRPHQLGTRGDWLLDYGRIITNRIGRTWDGGRRRVSRYGGAITAVVGPDAVGKSTAVGAVHDRFAEAFRVKVYHAGKPGPTLKTLPVRIARGIWRLTQRRQSSGTTSAGSLERPSLPHALNAWVVALERRAIVLKAHRQAARGAMVIFDRFPSQVPGGMDGPRLAALSGAPGLRGWLSAREADIYAELSPPHLVLLLTAPVAELLARDGARAKPDGDDYLRQRAVPEAGWGMTRCTRQVEIDSSPGAEAVTERAVDEMWEIF